MLTVVLYCNISQYFDLYCISDQINAALVSIRDYFQKQKSYRPQNSKQWSYPDSLHLGAEWTEKLKKNQAEGINVHLVRIRIPRQLQREKEETKGKNK